jgi:YggT family protein
MNDQIATIFVVFLYVLMAAIIVRSLLSWFPNVDRNNQFVQMLDLVTEPLLAPVRNIMPRTGMIDLSAMVVIIVLVVMVSVVQAAAAQ